MKKIYIYLLFYFFILFTSIKANFEENFENEIVENKITTDNDFSYVTFDLELDDYYIYEHFDDEKQYLERWVNSLSSKSKNKNIKYEGEWDIVNSHPKLTGDNCIIMKNKAKHYAISSKLLKEFYFDKHPLIVQYEVQFRNSQECGGAYIKLLSSPTNDLFKINDETPYTIMFGPDKCGNKKKLHFIFNHKNPINNTFREIHFNKANTINKLNEIFDDGKWHIFRLTLKPDNSFNIQIDKKIVASGNLLNDFNPSVNPPKNIDDPDDKKPDDWDDREKIPDPDAKKPDDWNENQPRKIVDPNSSKPSDWLENENEYIPDKNAQKPNDWDTEMDGQWEAPLIKNPKCLTVSGCGKWKPPMIENPKFKGKWKAPMIDNPDYKGKWKPRQIYNKDYFEDKFPYKMTPIDAVAFELWSISDNIAFDNILITEKVDVANLVLDHTYQIKKEIYDAETDNWFLKTIKETNKKPWLWIIYVLLIAVPLILFIGFCCVTSEKNNNGLVDLTGDLDVKEFDDNENLDDKIKSRKPKIKRDG